MAAWSSGHLERQLSDAPKTCQKGHKSSFVRIHIRAVHVPEAASHVYISTNADTHQEQISPDHAFTASLLCTSSFSSWWLYASNPTIQLIVSCGDVTFGI